MTCEKSVIVYWADKGHHATTISAKMESCFGASTPSYFWPPKLLRALKRGEDIFELCERSGMLQDPLTGLKILEFLNSTPFASIRQIATATRTSQSTSFDHLKGWDYTVQHSK
jgi:hypothetical protein